MSEDSNISSRAEQIGRRLKSFRETKRLKMSEVTALLGITQSRYKAYEKGISIPSLPELEILTIYFNIPISSLLAHDDQPVEEIIVDSVQTRKFMQLRQRIIATRLKKALDDAEISRTDIANGLGIKPKELSSYLSGKKPIPLAMLEVLSRIAAITIQSFFGTHGVVGERLSQAERIAGFKQLPSELQDFIAQPINRPYVDLAQRLSSLPVNKLRSIAEGLLDITF